MTNSLIVACAVVVLNLLVGVPAAYAMAKIRFRGRQASVYGILATRVIPDIALVVPFFLFIRKLGLLDSPWSLIITYLAITVPFSVFILVSYFESLPDELDKAARVDGCSRLQTLTRVYLPLALPSLVAVVLFAFLASWNEFLLALVFTHTPRSQTLPIIIASFTSDFTISFSFINAAGVLAIVPPVILAVMFERYIVSGLTAGAIKG
jgi:multiple sugar transport system permease protein